MLLQIVLLLLLSVSLATDTYDIVLTGPDDYTYSIPYDKTDFEGISSPSCGDEVPQMDVTKLVVPNQIRLSYTGDPTEMAIIWTTNNVTNTLEQVNYGLAANSLTFYATSVSNQYRWHKDNDTAGWYYTSGFISEAIMINLEPGAKHFYQIESNGVKSDVIEFIAAPAHGSTTPVSFFHVGDVGTFGTSVMITKDMMDRMKEKQFHGLVHCGDISYANKYDGSRPKNAEQKVWDTWGQMVEPIGSRMAYMAVPGNHELDIWDSTNEQGRIYAKRFILPGNERYFSYGVGMVHFVAVSTDESIDAASTQGVWFDNVLTKINEDRELWPWLVVYQHRPIYNSNNKHKNWEGREGGTSKVYDNPEIIGWVDNYPELILKHNVNLVLNGHVHHYERTWPMKDMDTWEESYENIRYPVHITCGHGGKNLYRWVYKNGTVDTYEGRDFGWTAARDNKHWGHCELDFVDDKTVMHRMYRMGVEAPVESVKITRSNGTAVFLSSLVALLSSLRFLF